MLWHDVVREVFGGFATLRHEPQPRMVIAVLACTDVVVGATDVLFVVAAISLLGMGQGGAGYLNAAFGLGGIAGAALAFSLVGRRHLIPPLAGGSALAGASIAAAAATQTPLGASAVILGAGAGRSIAYVAGTTLLQRVAPDEVLARVFGVLEGLGMLGVAIGSLLASGLVAAFGIRVALTVIGALLPVLIVLMWVPLTAIERVSGAPDAERLALVRAIPMFAPLPAPSIERVVRDLTPIRLPAGEVLIEEGEIGDRYFIVRTGRLVVSQNGVPIASQGPGDGIGEIALLRDIPRTATVRAVTDADLLALDRDSFLEAVTGHPRSTHVAEAIVRERMPETEERPPIR